MKRKKDIERLKDSFGKIKDESFNFDLIEKYFRNKDFILCPKKQS